MIEYDDKECVRLCLQGETETYSILVERYEKQVFNIVYQMIHNYENAQDVTQSIFIKVYEKLDSYKPKYKFFSWLYRIAVNETLNYIQREKKNVELKWEISSEEHSLLEDCEEEDEKKCLHEAVESMSIMYKSVIILKYFLQLSYEDIAYILDISEKKVKSRLFTARKKLRDYLIDKGYSIHA